MDNIYKYYIFDEEEVEEFVKAYQKGKHQSELLNMINEPVNRFKNADDEDHVDFKKKSEDTKAFTHSWHNYYHSAI